MKNIFSFVGVMVLTGGFLASVVRAEEYGKNDQAALGKALAGAKISLMQAITSSVKHGKAISAKYELEKGELQLSVYTEKVGKFFEVMVDHETGKVLKAEAITEGDDLKDAESQSAAMAKAKNDLKTFLRKIIKANKGFHAVSAIPLLQDGHAVVKIELIKGEKWKSITQSIEDETFWLNLP